MNLWKAPVRDLTMGLLLVLGAFAYSARYCDDSVFTSDAVDYLHAANRGFWVNYLDTGSAGLWGLVSISLKHPEARSGLWDYLDRNGDVAADLHFHVPFGLYPNMAAAFFGASDRAQRLVNAWEVGLIASIVFGGLRLAGARTSLALFTAAFVTVSPAMVNTATDVSPHAAFLAAMLVAAFALAHFLETGNKISLLASAGVFAAAAAALELSIVAAVAFCAASGPWLLRAGWRKIAPMLKQAALVFLAVLFLLWPGGWIRGGYALSYGVFIFQALVRRGTYFGNDSLAVTWMRGGQGSALILVVIAMAAVAAMLLLSQKRFSAYLQVSGWLAAAFAGQGMLNHFRNPAYASHFIVTAGVFSALCLQRWFDLTSGAPRYAVRAAAAAGALLTVFGARGWPALCRHRQQEQSAASARAEQVIGYVRQNLPGGATVISNKYNGVWKLYIPGLRVEKSASTDNLEPQAWETLREYPVIADPERLNDIWRERLERSAHETLGGFIVSQVSAHP
jgi:hypothetical protein